MKNHPFIIALILGMTILFAACGSDSGQVADKEEDKEKPVIAVSILPQRYFVQRLTGQRFAIEVLIPPGHSPHAYDPTPKQMQRLSDSSLYFLVGLLPFEKAWAANIAANNPNLEMIDTSRGVELINPTQEAETSPHHQGEKELETHHHHQGEENPGTTHHHEDEKHHGHDHTGIDPHIWLSPAAVKIQLKNMVEALGHKFPQYSQEFENNYQAFLQEIDALDRELRRILASLQGKKFMVFHPSWGYFARDYGLEQVAIEDEGKEPGPMHLKKMMDLAKAENLKVIFIQEQMDIKNAQAVAREINGKVITLDPLAEDWLINMKTIAQAMTQSLPSVEKEEEKE